MKLDCGRCKKKGEGEGEGKGRIGKENELRESIGSAVLQDCWKLISFSLLCAKKRERGGRKEEKDAPRFYKKTAPRLLTPSLLLLLLPQLHSLSVYNSITSVPRTMSSPLSTLPSTKTT